MMKTRMAPACLDNQTSWNFMVTFYEDFIAKPQWHFLIPLLRLVKAVAASERASKFRVGQTVTMLIISTTPSHGLKDDDAFVRAIVNPREDDGVLFEIHYQKPNRFSTRFWYCHEAEALTILDAALEQLWADTNELREATRRDCSEDY